MSKRPTDPAKLEAYLAADRARKAKPEYLARKRERYAARGPSGKHHKDPAPNIPEGHELGGMSTRINGDGELTARWDKSRVAGGEPTPLPEGFVPRAISRGTRGDGSVVLEWTQYRPEDAQRHRAIQEAWSRHAEQYAGLAGTAPIPARVDSDLMQVYPIGDPHVGMLSWAPETGEHFDTAIATRELLACMRELIDRAPPAEHAVICNLGDALHAQDDTNQTPGSGNRLEVDGRYPKVLDALHTVFRAVADYALLKHRHVTFRNLRGNHDPRVACELMFWLRAIYADEPRIHIPDAYAFHQYDHFGKNLIGWHHGDRTRKGELPAIMASDHDGSGTGLWGQTTEHVWHVGHEHHTTVLETPSCFVWVHNTLAGRDAWHSGRYRAKRMLRGFTYHREFGEDEIQTVSLARVRRALGGR